MRCKLCVMVNSRPDHVFLDGVCPACINNKIKIDIDWEAREKELLDLLDRHDGRCIVPSSGGKDSTYQVLKLIELGADPLIVTASTCHLTEIGRKNIDNLARYATTIEVSPNKTVRAKLNKLGLTMVADISWPEHAAIFSTPFNVSNDVGVSLIMYGENPQFAYGGPKGTEEAKTMTQRWIQEFGGFLGLRPSDFVGVDGITSRDMNDYEIRPSNRISFRPEAHFLGQYIQWDSKRNAEVAKEHGMIQKKPFFGNWWDAENLDNAQTGIHDYLMFKKYGYGRGCTQISVDIREGLVSREDALTWIKNHDGLLPIEYGGVGLDEILDGIDMTIDQFSEVVDEFSSKNNTNDTV